MSSQALQVFARENKRGEICHYPNDIVVNKYIKSISACFLVALQWKIKSEVLFENFIPMSSIHKNYFSECFQVFNRNYHQF